MNSIGSPNYISLSPYRILSPGQRTAMSFTSHWFLIQVISSIIDIYTFGNSKQIYFTSENMVANGWFKMYLNPDQFKFLKESTYFNLYAIEDKNKINLAKSNKNYGFYVHASKDWTPPTGSRIISRISDTIFLVDNLIINDEIRNDPRILKITPSFPKQSLNRYVTGFLQSGHQKSTYDSTSKIYAPIRSLHHLGLNGTGQIVNVVDTGVDVYNAFFYDPAPENDLSSITGKTNVNHRKVVRIEPIVDNTDAYRGHGTHVAGTACGSSYCTDCGISQYNGVAPSAKLYFSDIGNSTSGELSGTVDLNDQAKIFEELDIHVSSNSWGYGNVNPEVEFSYNKAAYDHPYVLYLFAAGNSMAYNTINCPGNAKNVLTVSASSFVSSSYLEFNPSTISIENETHSIQAEELMDTLVFKKSIDEKMKYFINLDLRKYDPSNSESDYKGNVVLLNTEPGLDEEICEKALKVSKFGAEAALYVANESDFRCEEPLPTIPLIRIIEKDNISSLLEMGKISLLPFSGEEREIPAADFLSSKGPANSGLKKPDIILPGSNIYSALSNGPDYEDYEINPSYSDNVVSKSGTSMATPACSGLAIIILQYLREGFYPGLKKGSGESIIPSSCLLKSLLVNTAIKPDTDENENKSSPRNDVGFGTPFLDKILGFNDTSLRFVDNQTIESNSHRVYKIILDSNSADLSVTLSYLDPPLNVDNEAILFADLDLFVKSPNGQIFYGNNVPEGDSLKTMERVVFDKNDIPSNGGEFEIHVVSNHYPIENQRVMFSIVVNGPFEMQNKEKNPLFLPSKDLANDDCPSNCNGNGKCEKGVCVCSDSFIGPFCNIKQIELKEGSFYNDTFNHKDIKYFRIPLEGKERKIEKVSFDLTKSDAFGSVYFCSSFLDSPGKIADSGWECHLAFIPNEDDERPKLASYSLKVPSELSPKYVNLAVYTGFHELEIIEIKNIVISLEILTPTTMKVITNKMPTLAIPFVVIAAVFIVVAIILLFFALRKKKITEINSAIGVNLLLNNSDNF